MRILYGWYVTVYDYDDEQSDMLPMHKDGIRLKYVDRKVNNTTKWTDIFIMRKIMISCIAMQIERAATSCEFEKNYVLNS